VCNILGPAPSNGTVFVTALVDVHKSTIDRVIGLLCLDHADDFVRFLDIYNDELRAA
jgi:hypothetical protein